MRLRKFTDTSWYRFFLVGLGIELICDLVNCKRRRMAMVGDNGRRGATGHSVGVRLSSALIPS